MVAGLPRKSRNVSNHFMPTRPAKQDLSLPDLEQRGSKQTLILRPKNDPGGSTVVASSKTKVAIEEQQSNNGVKRRTAMASGAEEKPTSSHDRTVINEAKRRYVLRPQIGYSANSINMMMSTNTNTPEDSYYSPDEQVVSGILDGITSLCLGPTTYPQHYRPGVSSRSSGGFSSRRPSSPLQRRKKKVIYPIVSYPARLNCKKLVSERRAIFQQNLFRPVSSDEMSHYHQSVRA